MSLKTEGVAMEGTRGTRRSGQWVDSGVKKAVGGGAVASTKSQVTTASPSILGSSKEHSVFSAARPLHVFYLRSNASTLPSYHPLAFSVPAPDGRSLVSRPST